ncbi:MAG: hypothetical protein HY815_14190, partial [Candidatus Riflebacteria bacterium]|nr:hypothetical protein [Candidatus Riflebacteria bacterium]
GMYTDSSLDVYKGGWATFGLVKLARPLKLYVGYTYAPFTAPWQEDLRRDLPGRVFLSDRFVSILSFGLDYMF